MFDWNDEELANIVWGEAEGSDDHIVPSSEASEDLHNKKDRNQEASAIKLTEQKITEANTEFHERKLGSNSKLDSSAGLSALGSATNSWPDLSLSSSAKSDQGSLGTEVSKSLGEINKFSSIRGEENIQLEKDVDIFQSTHEGKEQVDFVDYGWANIGSFDDLDQIFSNDDSIFGHASLENSNELWSSKDASNCINSPARIPLEAPSRASDLRNRSEPLEIKTEYVQPNNQSFSLSYKTIDDPASHDIQNAHTTTLKTGYARAKSKHTGKEQQDMVRRTSSVTSALVAKNVASAKGLADKVKQEGKLLQNFYGNSTPTTPSGQFGNQLVPSVVQSSPSSIVGQQKQLQGPKALHRHITNPYVTSTMCGNLTNAYPAMSMLPPAQSGDLRQHFLLSEYEVSPGIVNPAKKPTDSVKSLTMTPQEKIEKLRRRQQMQAMLAIQKQQQQLGHQVPSTNKSMTQKYPLEMQSHLFYGADPEVEGLRTLPALELPTEQDDSNAVSVATNDHSVEDTILFMLQDIISKLDVKIRLCIRNSLFRLAQSAMQRHYVSDTSSTNKSSRDEVEALTREESNSQNRFAKIPDVETETNPIDRIVAHLLFHRPLELTGNYSDKLDSPISAKMQYVSKAANLENFPGGCLPDEDMQSDQEFPHQGLKNSCSLFEAQPVDQFKNSPCIDTSENASNTEPADVGSQELEASQ